MFWRNYNRLLLAVISVPILALAAYVYLADPYWIFHNEPIWKNKWGGHNRVLDVHQRYAKSLQLLERQPTTIVLGSSRVYRGIPTDQYTDKAIYNLGISNLRIREAYSFITFAHRWTPTKEIVFGLDYFMFNSKKTTEPGFDVTMDEFKYPFKAIPASVFTKMAYNDAQLALNGVHQGDGFWTITGFKHTNPRTPKELNRILNIFYKNENIISSREYDYFKKIINYSKDKGVMLRLFLSPLNNRMISRLKEKGQYQNFINWKTRLFAICKEQGLNLYDYTENNPFYWDDTSQGSTNLWIDTSHYSPKIGEWILREVGLDI